MIRNPGAILIQASEVDGRKTCPDWLFSDRRLPQRYQTRFKKRFSQSFRRVALALFLLATFKANADENFPPELTQFVPSERNPIFTAAGPGHWDVKIRERGWILREGNQWKMWYTGYDGTRPGQKMLGYATSSDGIVWQRFPKNPIYSEHWVEDVCVIPHDGLYYMFAEGVEDRAQLLTSRDGITWNRLVDSMSGSLMANQFQMDLTERRPPGLRMANGTCFMNEAIEESGSPGLRTPKFSPTCRTNPSCSPDQKIMITIRSQ